MRYLIILTGLILMANVSCAEIYAVFDKETGECKGTVDIKEDYVSDWAKNFILKRADESYRGKQSFEVKLEKGKLRHATQEEIVEATKPIIFETLSQEEIKKLKELIK